MLRSLRERIHVALNLEPRDELAGFWAGVIAIFSGIAFLVYVSNPDNPQWLFFALSFANSSLSVLFRPARKKPRSWRQWGAILVVLLGCTLVAVYWRPFEKVRTYFVLSGGLALCLAWQSFDYFSRRPLASERSRQPRA